jgi:hypothetical protein
VSVFYFLAFLAMQYVVYHNWGPLAASCAALTGLIVGFWARDAERHESAEKAKMQELLSSHRDGL